MNEGMYMRLEALKLASEEGIDYNHILEIAAMYYKFLAEGEINE